MLSNKKVLIVDDNKNYSDLCRDQLYYLGFAVKQVWAGETVGDAITEFSPDLIILDLMLPGMSGQEVLHQLKNNPETHNIPVIVLTAILFNQNEENELKKLASDFIVKIDVTPRELGQRVAELLSTQA